MLIYIVDNDFYSKPHIDLSATLEELKKYTLIHRETLEPEGTKNESDNQKVQNPGWMQRMINRLGMRAGND